MLVDDFARPNPSPEALRNNLPLLLNRPAPPPLASGDHLDPLRRGSHMTSLMTAPYRTVALDRRMLAVHAKPSAHRPRSRQGVLSTPLTDNVGTPQIGRALDTRAQIGDRNPGRTHCELIAQQRVQARLRPHKQCDLRLL